MPHTFRKVLLLLVVFALAAPAWAQRGALTVPRNLDQLTDLATVEWRIPAARMKMKQDHIVPLSRQAVAILREQREISGQGRYVFRGLRGSARCISNNTINAALRGLGYSKREMTGHGFRTTASTLLHEQGFDSDVIERQLAHTEGNKTKAAYNRAAHLPERRSMMQAWADYLDKLRRAAAAAYRQK